MAADTIQKILESYAGARKQFSLSEFRDSCCPSEELTPLLISLLPIFSKLSLGWRGSSRDYQIFRILRKPHLSLSDYRARALTAQVGTKRELATLQDLTEQYIGHKTGKPWNDPDVLRKIRSAIMQQKGQYWKEGEPRRIGYRKGYAVIAYLAYHAPVYFSQFQHAFLMLIKDGLIPNHARILDVGSGPGVVPLAISACARDIPEFSAELFALERSEEFLEAYRFLVTRFIGDEPRITAYPAVSGDLRDAGALLLPSAIDLMVIQNVTNELVQESPESRAGYLKSLSGLLAPEGCMIVLEPAELRNATELRKMVQAASGHDLHVHSPCTCIWKDRCAAERCWSFTQKPPIYPTRLMTALAGNHDAFRFLNTDIKFSYAVLVKDTKRRHCYTPDRDSPFIPLSSLKGRLGRRVNVAGALMSGDIGDTGTHVFLICDGTSRQPVYAILPHFHISPENQELLNLPYSSILEISDALVRFNKKHGAWNLFLTRNSRVNPVSRAFL
ncbi:MAG: small ribosomal subunit Rsm22 family protein [Methanoregulaceae archaeon]|nr:small ribosomal subunit Rsm22 family protein [Methanoregulaceae archaeon]